MPTLASSVYIFFHTMVLSRLCRRGRAVSTISGWDHVQELIVLVWNSKPDLRFSGSNVEVRGARWRVRVAIRADTAGRTHLTVEEEGMEMLTRGRPCF